MATLKAITANAQNVAASILKSPGATGSRNVNLVSLPQPAEFHNVTASVVSSALDGVAFLANSGVGLGNPTGICKIINITPGDKMINNEKSPNWATGVRELLFQTSGMRNQDGNFINSTGAVVNFNEVFAQNFGLDTDAPTRSVFSNSGNFHFKLGKKDCTGMISPPHI